MSHRKNKAISHKSARESGERLFVRKRWETADILCVFQGFPNAFLAERIRQNPMMSLCGFAEKEKPDKKQTFQSASYPATASVNSSPSERRLLYHGAGEKSTKTAATPKDRSCFLGLWI